MIDIEKIKPEIIERLKPLKPDKIILFGSYAYGEPNDESDIDLFLIKNDLSLDELDEYEIKAKMNIRDLIYKYKVGFDILSAPIDYIKQREDYFYKVEILNKGKVLYEQTSSD
jgi:predicted nucleotidyltransferase